MMTDRLAAGSPTDVEPADVDSRNTVRIRQRRRRIREQSKLKYKKC